MATLAWPGGIFQTPRPKHCSELARGVGSCCIECFLLGGCKMKQYIVLSVMALGWLAVGQQQSHATSPRSRVAHHVEQKARRDAATRARLCARLWRMYANLGWTSPDLEAWSHGELRAEIRRLRAAKKAAKRERIPIERAVVSYEMPNGDRGYYGVYGDESYNGDGNPFLAGDYLHGGVGQLTDGIVDDQDTIDASYDLWVGWDDRQPVIVFDFAENVAIDTVSIHCNNQISGGIDLFGEVAVAFSDDGESWIASQAGAYTTTEEQRADLTARFVDVPVSGQGRFCRLSFQEGNLRPGQRSRWIFIDEVRFLGGETRR